MAPGWSLSSASPRPDSEAGPGVEAATTREAPPSSPPLIPAKAGIQPTVETQRSANKDDHQACRAFHALRWLDSRFRGSERRLVSRLGRIPNLTVVAAFTSPLRHSGEGRNPSKCAESGAALSAGRRDTRRPRLLPKAATFPTVRDGPPSRERTGSATGRHTIESAARPASFLNSVACANRAQPYRPRPPCSRQHTRPYNPRIVPTR
jgi:hypothetical protein